MNLDTGLKTIIKINSKWIVDLNVKCKPAKLLEDGIGKNLSDLGFDDSY